MDPVGNLRLRAELMQRLEMETEETDYNMKVISEFMKDHVLTTKSRLEYLEKAEKKNKKKIRKLKRSLFAMQCRLASLEFNTQLYE